MPDNLDSAIDLLLQGASESQVVQFLDWIRTDKPRCHEYLSQRLRDALAEYLGRQGDSEDDGLTWEYRQGQGPHEAVIEVFDGQA